MPISYNKTTAVFKDVVSIEDVDALIEWLNDHPNGSVQLKDCQHIHTASVQVLMRKRPKIQDLPKDDDLSSWLKTILLSNVN